MGLWFRRQVDEGLLKFTEGSQNGSVLLQLLITLVAMAMAHLRELYMVDWSSFVLCNGDS